MNCLLTGSTGIVGSHIIFEWLQKALTTQTVGHLFVIIRPNEIGAQERLTKILTDVSRPAFMDDFTLEKCLSKITVIPYDVSSLTEELLSDYNFDTVIHCAGSTSLLHTNDTKELVKTQNYSVTKHLLSCLPTKVDRFIYISTAFSFGIQDQIVDDSIDNYIVDKFRNPYEGSKYESEVFVKKYCIENKIQFQILRPSIICGRLIDAPFFETPKFDVFYSWAIFLDKYAEKSVDRFRIWIDKKSGLNIVPVDFVAKAVLHAFLTPELQELNIINPEQILHKEYVGDVLESFEIDNYEYVDKKPKDLNVFESLYYKTIGNVFENYISIPELQFEPKLILKLIEQLKLETNLGVHQNFMNLINFSVEKKFRKSYI